MRVGKIVEIEECPNFEKLYIVKIDIGEEELRVIATGAKPFTDIEEMKKDPFICFFANLKPRKMAHIMS